MRRYTRTNASHATAMRKVGVDSGGVSHHNGDGHTWHNPDHQLTAWTVNGRIGDMPAFGERLENREVIAVLAFIKTWWTEEQRLSQADLTLRYQDALEKAR